MKILQIIVRGDLEILEIKSVKIDIIFVKSGGTWL